MSTIQKKQHQQLQQETGIKNAGPNRKRKLNEVSDTKPSIAKSINAKIDSLAKSRDGSKSSHLNVGSVDKQRGKSQEKDRGRVSQSLKVNGASQLRSNSNQRSISKGVPDNRVSANNARNLVKSSGKAPANSNTNKKSKPLDQRDKSQKQSIANETDDKGNKKLITEDQMAEIEEGQAEENKIDLTQSQVIIGNMFSLYALADKQPAKIKAVLDQIFQHDENTEEFVVKTMFLYFMELMGYKDETTLQYFVNYIAKNTEEKKLLELFSEEEDKPELDFTKLVFFSQERKQMEHKKQLKKVCKIFIADVVDLLPDKSLYLASVVQRVCVFSKSVQRLTRYVFTYIGLYLFKFLLTQMIELQKLRNMFEEKQKQELLQKNNEEAKKSGRRVDSINSALEVVKDNLELINKHIIMKRYQDSWSQIRRSLYDFLTQLEEKEIQAAFNSKLFSSSSQASNNRSKAKQGDLNESQEGREHKSHLLEIVFGALSDEDSQIKKQAIQMVFQISSKLSSDKETSKYLMTYLQRYKMQIYKLAIPTEKHSDVISITRALQIIQKLLEIIPDAYSKEHIQILVNHVHYKNQTIKEEVGDLLLQISDEFDDDSLLELQKINPSKGVPEDFALNFNEQPGKSRKQILKLIQMFEKHVQTRSNYLTENKKSEDSGEIVVPTLAKEEIQKILSCDQEERAILLFQVFMRKTSVIYDSQSLVTLLKRDDIEEDTKVVIANLIYISLTYTLKAKLTPDNPNLVHTKLWECQSAYLKLTLMNELLQTFRVQPRVLEPLLKTLLILSQTTVIEKENHQAGVADELGKDLTHLMIKVIENTEIEENKLENALVIKAALMNLISLQAHFPLMKNDIKHLGLDLCEKLQREVIPKLFNDENGISFESIGFIQKFTILMSQLPFKQIADSQYLQGLAAFAIVNFTQMISDNYHLISKITRTQFNTLLLIPFGFLNQLLSDNNHLNKEYLTFQVKMLYQLQDFFLDLHSQYKSDEEKQTVLLKFIIETVITSSAENRQNSNNSGADSLNKSENAMQVTSNINDFPRIKEFLIDAIQIVSNRLKCNELLIQEQFQLLSSLFLKDFSSLLSEPGVEFLINFGCTKDPVVSRDLRKLYNVYKQRDCLIDQKKSIFYQFLLKVVYTIYQSSDSKIYKLQEAVPADIEKERQALGLADLKSPEINLQLYSKVAYINLFLKNFQNAVMLTLINPKSQNNSALQNGLNKQQDEYAYFKLIEGIIKLAVQDKTRNLPLLLVIKQLMHKNFLQQKQQIATIKGLRNYIETNREGLMLSDDEMKSLELIIKIIDDKVQGSSVKDKKAQKTGVPQASSNNISLINGTANELNQKSDNLNVDGSKQRSADVTMNLSLTVPNIQPLHDSLQADEEIKKAVQSNQQNKFNKANQDIIRVQQTIGMKRKKRSDSKDSDNSDDDQLSNSVRQKSNSSRADKENKGNQNSNKQQRESNRVKSPAASISTTTAKINLNQQKKKLK